MKLTLKLIGITVLLFVIGTAIDVISFSFPKDKTEEITYESDYKAPKAVTIDTNANQNTSITLSGVKITVKESIYKDGALEVRFKIKNIESEEEVAFGIDDFFIYDENKKEIDGADTSRFFYKDKDSDLKKGQSTEGILIVDVKQKDVYTIEVIIPNTMKEVYFLVSPKMEQ